MRGLPEGWPLVEAGRQSAATAMALIASFESGGPAEVMLAPPGVRGRFFYGPDLRGFNFTRQKASLSDVGRKLLRISLDAETAAGHLHPPAPTETHDHMPLFDATPSASACHHAARRKVAHLAMQQGGSRHAFRPFR